MPVLALAAQAAGGLASAANSSGPTSLETDLMAKVANTWGSSFSVGTGSRATSSPSNSDSSGSSIPQEYIIAGGIIAAALGLALLVR